MIGGLALSTPITLFVVPTGSPPRSHAVLDGEVPERVLGVCGSLWPLTHRDEALGDIDVYVLLVGSLDDERCSRSLSHSLFFVKKSASM